MRKWLLPVVIIIFALLSILTLKSVAPSLATQQLVYFLLAGVVFVVIGTYPYHFWSKYTWIAYAGLCVLLVIPLLIGKTTRGIAGWIDIGPFFSIQPSQLAIPVVGLVLAGFTARQPLQKLNNLAAALVICGVPAVLILVEPDLGTTIVYLGSMAAIIFLGGIQWKHIFALLGLGVAIAILSWFLILKEYQKDRITSFLGSSQDPQGASYNAQQALIAVGSGQLLGRGLGQGVQSHLRFLPERQTDFIFASLAEELGLFGAGIVILLYSLLISFCIWLWFQTPDPSAQYYVVAAGVMTALQASINIGMNMGIFPITGITLPLLSYGGSSAISICLMYALVWSIAKQTKTSSFRHFS